MDEFEERLNAVLNNPQMMAQIMSMAQSLGGSPDGEGPREAPPEKSPAVSKADSLPLRKFAELAGKSGIDKEQQALIKALSPYLHKDRIDKLEQAMRAAKLAQLATALLGSGGLQSLLGR